MLARTKKNAKYNKNAICIQGVENDPSLDQGGAIMDIPRIKNRHIIIFLFSLSTMSYYLPYLGTTYYVPFIEAYHLTNMQAGTLISAYSFVAIPAYFFGGILADKFPAKRLIVLSCILTGILGISMVFETNYYVILAHYMGYGFTVTFLGWSALCRLIRTFGTEKEQGKLFGTMELSIAIVGALINYGILSVLGKILETTGFKVVSGIFGGFLLVIGVIIMIFCEDRSAGKRTNDFKINMVGKALKHPVVWMNGIMVMGFYISTTASSYNSPYMSEVLLIPTGIAVGIQIFDYSLSKVVFSPLGGVMRDRIGKTSPILIFVGIAAIILLTLMRITSTLNTMPYIFIILLILLISVTSTARTAQYTPVPEGGVPMVITGTAMGIVSAIGYSSDLWLYRTCGGWIDTYGVEGYHRIWLLMSFGMLIVIITAIVFQKYLNRNKDAIQAIYKENEENAKRNEPEVDDVIIEKL